jgi:hypothetical protein
MVFLFYAFYTYRDINIGILPLKSADPGTFGLIRRGKKVLIDRFTMDFMDNKISTSGILRFAAAVILGIIVGFILFLIVALFIGMFNNWMGMDIPVGTDVAENLISAVLLVIFVVGSVAGFCWKVWTTPPTEEEEETPAP